MYNNRNNEAGGYCLLLMLGVGFIIIPLIAVYTVLHDGWENTPPWMRLVATLTLMAMAFEGVSLVVNFLHSPC